jgi:serine phosphatase RsbU (regulator of sigma subunit)
MIGPNIGIERLPFRNHEFALEEEDIIYLFSDGFADQFGGPEGKKFMYRRFRHLLLSVFDQPMSVQRHIIEKSLNEWKGGLEQVDDILVLGVKPLQKTSTGFYNRDLILSTSSST